MSLSVTFSLTLFISFSPPFSLSCFHLSTSLFRYLTLFAFIHSNAFIDFFAQTTFSFSPLSIRFLFFIRFRSFHTFVCASLLLLLTSVFSSLPKSVFLLKLKCVLFLFTYTLQCGSIKKNKAVYEPVLSVQIFLSFSLFLFKYKLFQKSFQERSQRGKSMLFHAFKWTRVREKTKFGKYITENVFRNTVQA